MTRVSAAVCGRQCYSIFFAPANFKRVQELNRHTGDNALPYRSWQGSTGCDPFTASKDILDNQVAIIEYASGVRATFQHQL